MKASPGPGETTWDTSLSVTWAMKPRIEKTTRPENMLVMEFEMAMMTASCRQFLVKLL